MIKYYGPRSRHSVWMRPRWLYGAHEYFIFTAFFVFQKITKHSDAWFMVLGPKTTKMTPNPYHKIGMLCYLTNKPEYAKIGRK